MKAFGLLMHLCSCVLLLQSGGGGIAAQSRGFGGMLPQKIEILG